KGCIIRIYTITPNKSILLNDRFASDVKNRDFATYFDKLLTRYQAAANIAICRGNGQCLYRIDREQAMLLQWCESE
ncbi:MAG: hypothetical protein OXQ96_03080, partial [Alphaproteobacteria bacterium]|nr:hypothetical protein [Alphaproteobacteria bacterium]